MNNINNKGFSLIELLVAIFIFSMGIVSVFSVIISTLNLNDYNKNYIVAASLAKEQIELVRNIRDSNYNKIQVYNQINPSLDYKEDSENFFQTGSYYKIENDFSNNSSFPVKVEKIVDFIVGDGIFIEKMNDYHVCLDKNNIYTYDCNPNNLNTPFYKFIKIEEVKYIDGNSEIIIPDAIKVTSKVIWLRKGFKEFEIVSIFTDYKRF